MTVWSLAYKILLRVNTIVFLLNCIHKEQKAQTSILKSISTEVEQTLPTKFRIDLT